MMILPTEKKPPNHLDDNVIPLINVVFLMLIFFMMAGQLTTSEQIAIQPPQSSQPKPMVEHEAVLLVSADGRMALDETLLEADMLTPVLQQKIAGHPEKQRFTLLVKTDAMLPASALTDVLKQVRAAGILKVSLATQTRQASHD